MEKRNSLHEDVIWTETVLDGLDEALHAVAKVNDRVNGKAVEESIQRVRLGAKRLHDAAQRRRLRELEAPNEDKP